MRTGRLSAVSFALLLSSCIVSVPSADAQTKNRLAGIPGNMSPGLRHLVEHLRLNQPVDLSKEGLALDIRTGKFGHAALKKPVLVYDSNNRILVDVHLNGRMTATEMRNALEKAGGKVTVQNEKYHRGVVEAFVPLGAIESTARLAGTGTVHQVVRAITNVGLTTSQGSAVHRADVANSMGFTGKGVTVGLISNSYNTSQFPPFNDPDTALVDVMTGDLPNTTAIPGGEGLKFLIEQDPNIFGPDDDEGRGMSQIVHDMAPDAQLCYATANGGQPTLALNILTLADKTLPNGCGADVISDDVVYPDEPMYSDGIVAQAVDAVSAAGVPYFSSAGNQAQAGYTSKLRIIPDAAARALPNQPVDLSSIPAVDQNGVPIDTSGGFHNFSEAGAPQIAQLIAFDNPQFTFQWDDPFDATDANGNPQVSTDLDVLFFDPASGKFLFAANTDNFMLNEPLELFNLGGSGELFLVISRKGTDTVTSAAPPDLATHVKYVVFGGFAAQFVTPQTPITFGHNSAASANGVAAYQYTGRPGFTFAIPGTRGGGTKPEYEGFSSPGPVQIFFDANGNRLSSPEVRLKPTMAAVDGVNTTFFPEAIIGGSDFEAIFGVPDGFPNFFGTSAASPHAASIAALLIQKAGGPGKLSAAQVTNALTSSAPPRDVDFFFSKGTAQGGGARVSIVAQGQNLAAVAADPNFFNVNFSSSVPGQTLDSLTIDLSATGLNFVPGSFPVTQGSSSGGVTIASSAPGMVSPTITINFSGFQSGKSLHFGVDRDWTVGTTPIESGGSSADHVGGATFTAVLSGGQTITGTISNRQGKQYLIYDGFGLIDAVNALAQIHSGS